MTTVLLLPLNFIKSLITHLWLSISSVKFYENVFKHYTGYGTKYIFTLSFISALFCCILLLNQANDIKLYLTKNIIPTSLKNIDHIITQLPTIDYDGEKISIQEETPLFINDLNNNKALVIDPSNKLMPNERSKINLILGSNKATVNFIDAKGTLAQSFPFEYKHILGNNAQTLTQEDIKSIFVPIFESAQSKFIYIIFPIITCFIFLATISEKIVTIIIIFIIIYLNLGKTSIKTCIRMVCFSSGTFAIFQPIVILALPHFAQPLWIIQTWANFLMILGILKATGKFNFSFRKY